MPTSAATPRPSAIAIIRLGDLVCVPAVVGLLIDVVPVFSLFLVYPDCGLVNMLCRPMLSLMLPMVPLFVVFWVEKMADMSVTSDAIVDRTGLYGFVACVGNWGYIALLMEKERKRD